MKPSALRHFCLPAVLALSVASAAWSQTAWDANAVAYEGPPVWQQAAVAALNRHLPTDSGYWVLGPLDRSVDLPDTTRLVQTTLRILAPNPRGSRSVTRRLWLPTGGVVLEELQPSDTLPHELPPGYPGRFVQGTIVGERTYVQVLTVQEHRWLLWAQRAQLVGIRERVVGPVVGYSIAVTRYLAAIDSGHPGRRPPRPGAYGLDRAFGLYAEPPAPVIREREGYLELLDRNRSLSLEAGVRDVYGFVPGPPLVSRLEEGAEGVLFVNKEGEIALQHRYRDYLDAGGRWEGYPVLSANSISRLRPGRYLYLVDRYGVIRVGRAPSAAAAASGAAITTALLAQNEPVRAAGELVLAADRDGRLRVSELNIKSEEYFFSNLSITLYRDVEERSDRYVRAVGHVLKALDAARVPREGVLIRKF